MLTLAVHQSIANKPAILWWYSRNLMLFAVFFTCIVQLSKFRQTTIKMFFSNLFATILLSYFSRLNFTASTAFTAFIDDWCVVFMNTIN
jgi:hypothetical protein